MTRKAMMNAAFGLPSALCVLLSLSACGELTEVVPPTPLAPDSAPTIQLRSALACKVDSDCAEDTFCFQGICTSECSDEVACATGEVCSERGRCIHSAFVEGTEEVFGQPRADQSRMSAFSEDLSGIEVVSWPPSYVTAAPGASSVTVAIELDQRPPEGALLYALVYHDSSLVTPRLRAEGDTHFEITVPLPSEHTGPVGVDLITSLGQRTVTIVSPLELSGIYRGTTSALEFGGAALPLEFALEVYPSDATTLEEATERYVWVTTDPAYLLSLPNRTTSAAWLRAPLSWDASVQSWVATFSTPVRSEAYVGSNLYPDALRTIRMELRELDSEKRTFQGAFTDRWRGIHERRSVDAIAENGVAVVSSFFEVSRDGRVQSSDVADAPVQAPGAIPSPTPNLQVCTSDIIARTVDVAPGQNPDEAFRPCGIASNGAELANLDPETMASCGLALRDVALQGETVSSKLRAYIDPSLENPYSFPFDEFLEHCASSSSTFCSPSPAVACARNVSATAYREVSGAYANFAALAEAYDALSNELFLGQKLGAFQTDTTKRLEWLRSSEAPLFLASALRDYNESLLNSWRDFVLQPHLEVVFDELDAAGLAFLTRSTTDPDAIAWRASRVLQVATAWQTAAESLSLYVKRRNVIDQNAVTRSARGREAQQIAFRLYLTGAILADVARDASVSAYVSPFGPYLSSLFVETRRLTTPFSRLLFARDAEVVTSQSLDPTSNSRTLLGELRTDAIAAIGNANQSVQMVLTEADNAALTEEYILTRYEEQLLRVRNELIQLCGLKTGCLASEVGEDSACAISTEIDGCGFALQRGQSAAVTTDVGISEASAALLSINAAGAALEVQIARERAAMTEINILAEEASAFHAMLEKLHEQRLTTHAQVLKFLDEMAQLNADFVAATLQTVTDQQRIRKEAYEAQAAAVDRWQQIQLDGEEADASKVRDIRNAQNQALILRHTADMILLAGEVAADSLEDDITDISFFVKAKAATLAIAYGVQLPLSSAAINQEIKGNNLSAVLEEGFFDTQFAQEANDLTQLEYQNTIAELNDALLLGEVQTQREVQTLEGLIDALKEAADNDERYSRDLSELRDRRDALLVALANYQRHTYDIEQARLTIRQRVLNYMEIVQRAQILQAQFDNMKSRFGNVEALLGSPDVIFAFHNQMMLAESRLDNARKALENWLVALEYYAVRPFVDQRMAILLARNPQQLEAISNELVRLQNACGGVVSSESVELSLRDDLLRSSFASTTSSGATISAGERFRALLARAQSGASRSVRISTEETVGGRLARGNILAADFRLEIDAFANLAQTCNAKVASIATQLVGMEDQGGLPVVTIVYDGNSQLRSCQADIQRVVRALGPDATAFKAVTPFRTGGRAISPIAGQGSFGAPQTWNATLEGTPLAAGYTVLIDLEHPSNKALDWSQLEDIRLLVNYSHQDVFVAGQCE